jgi:hypothetical protein
LTTYRPLCPVGCVRHLVELPKIFQTRRVLPRFHVAEPTFSHYKLRFELGGEQQECRVGPGKDLRLHLMAQTEIVIPPHPNRLHVSQKGRHLWTRLPGFEGIKRVAQGDDSLNPSLSEDRQSVPQRHDGVMDVCHDPDEHSFPCSIR